MTKKRLIQPKDLINAGLIADSQEPMLDAISRRYAIGVTDTVQSSIQTHDDRDPVWRQYIPNAAELRIEPDDLTDPIGDERHSPVKGLVHRHKDRVLLMPTQACAVYCRFCFRREKVGPGQKLLSEAELNAAFAYIRNRPEIREVILTGGDPLSLPAKRVIHILQKLADSPHIETIRFHTRIPVAAPDYIKPELLNFLNDFDPPVYMVIHINHAQELTPKAVKTFKALHRSGCILLSQSVLLKNVNDTIDALEDLMRGLIRNRVTPYYLHHPDMAMGTRHFRVEIETGQALMKQLRQRLTGIAMPRYVIDIPGGYGKIPLDDGYARQAPDGRWILKDYSGKLHDYGDMTEEWDQEERVAKRV